MVIICIIPMNILFSSLWFHKKLINFLLLIVDERKLLWIILLTLDLLNKTSDKNLFANLPCWLYVQPFYDTKQQFSCLIQKLVSKFSYIEIHMFVFIHHIIVEEGMYWKNMIQMWSKKGRKLIPDMIRNLKKNNNKIY